MNERDPEQLNTPDADYSLEDIVREFGSEQPSETVCGDTISFPAVRAVSSEDSDTIAFTPVRRESDTVAFPPVRSAGQAGSADETIKFIPPVSEDEAIAPEEPDEDPGALPELIPIPTQKERQKTAAPTPQSVLQEAAAGRKLQLLRTVLLGILAGASVFLTLYAVQIWDFMGLAAETPSVLLIVILSVSVLLSYDVLWRGVRDLIRFHPSPFTLSIPLIVLAGLDAFRAEPSRPGNYCGAVTLLLFFLMCALCAERSGRYRTLRAVCGFRKPMGIFSAPPVDKGAPSLRRDPASVGSFLNDLLQEDKPRMILSLYCTILFPLSAALAFLLTRRSGDFFLAWLLLLLGGLPFFAALGYPRVFAILARRLSKIDGALSGWHSAKIFGRKHTIIIRDEDLFPVSGITTNGMKIYGAYRPNRIISYALAALDAAGSPLTGLFEGLLKAQYGTHSVLSQHRFYDSGGIGAEIAGDVVLVGSLSFMRSMGVQMPAGAKVRLAVYISVNGELAGIFAFKYKANASSRKGLRDVLANRSFSVVLAARDFLITPELIAAKYRFPTDRIKFPAFPERLRLAELDPNRRAEQGGLIAEDTFGAFASTVAAGRSLRIVSLAAVVICLFVAALGIALCSLIVLWNSKDAASPVHILTFQLLWAFVLDFVTLILLRF